MTMQQLAEAQVNPEIPVNRNFQSLEHQSVYAQRQSAHSGLTYGYYGGRWGGFSVADGTLTLTNTASNYVVVAIASGTISTSTSTTNWNDTTNYVRVYKLTTAGGVVTATEDHRTGPGGVHGQSSSAGGTPLMNTVTALSIVSGVVNIDCSLGDYFTLTMTANVTSLTFSNLPGADKGASKWIDITQGSGPYTFAYPASFKWVGGVPVPISTTNGALDSLAIVTLDNGTTWKPTLGRAFS